MEIIDRILNKTTMYRLVLYGLFVLIAVAWIESLFGLIRFPIISFVLYLGFCISISGIISLGFAKILKVTIGQESWLITALILFLIVDYPRNSTEVAQVLGILVLAQAGKYIFQWKKLHIFNPAAMATFTAGLLGSGMASWWVGSKNMLPAVVFVGFLVVKKIKREKLVILTLLLASLWAWFEKVPLQYVWLSGPLIFFATIMLTEPITGANNKLNEIVMAMVVGLTYHKGPEISLLFGNLCMFFLAKKRAYIIYLIEKKNLGGEVWSFKFKSKETIKFKPGQYMEWTLARVKIDGRGNRRYFTIANGPDDAFLQLVVRIPETRFSQYKQRLLQMDLNDEMKISVASGDFVISKKDKMAWMAGGIGITPFASMATNISRNNLKPILVYINKNNNFPMALEIENTGIPVYRHTTDRNGYLEKDIVAKVIPDYKNRIFFVSGPGGMVARYKNDLREMGVKKIVTDYFPGF